MERGGKKGKKEVWDSAAWRESERAREEEKKKRERAVGRVQSDVQTAGYTSELMLPQKAIFSTQAPHPLCR